MRFWQRVYSMPVLDQMSLSVLQGFHLNDKVLASWSDCRFYPAKVISVNKDGGYQHRQVLNILFLYTFWVELSYGSVWSIELMILNLVEQQFLGDVNVFLLIIQVEWLQYKIVQHGCVVFKKETGISCHSVIPKWLSLPLVLQRGTKKIDLSWSAQLQNSEYGQYLENSWTRIVGSVATPN